jgi:hypothetical protein
MTTNERAKAWGRIGGLRAWAMNEPEVMVGPAHRGFRTRFERLVDPEGSLPPAERVRRAERAMRAHMLTLAARSADARRRSGKEAGPVVLETSTGPTEVRRATAERPLTR